jgi:hypothetical protein
MKKYRNSTKQKGTQTEEDLEKAGKLVYVNSDHARLAMSRSKKEKEEEKEDSYMAYFISACTYFRNAFFQILSLCTWFLDFYL